MKLGKKEKRTVLVSRFEALGDVAMTLPPVYDACAANPGDTFIYMTPHHPAQVFINKPDNLTIAPVNPDNYKGPGGKWRLAKALRKRYGITDYLDLQDDGETRWLRMFLRMSGVRTWRIDNGVRARKELTRRNNKVLVQLKPMPERHRDVFYKAEIALANDFEGLYGKGKGNPAEFAKASGPKREGEHWLAIAPFAKYKSKIYPMDQLDRVIGHFNKKEGEKIFILGFGDEEREQIEKFARRFDKVVNVAKLELGIASELALLSHCDVLLSMDSGNMHLASLVGLRTVSVWGATHPYAGFMGWGQRTRDVVQLEMTCRPCSVIGDRPCFRRDYHCLAGITPKMIVDKIEGA